VTAETPGGATITTTGTAITSTSATSTLSSAGGNSVPQNGGINSNDSGSSSSGSGGGLAAGAIAGIAVGAAAVVLAIIAAAFILRSRRRKKALTGDSEPEVVENIPDNVAFVPPPAADAEKKPSSSIERNQVEVFNPYPGPNDNPQ
jgi:hypothetical protein